MNSTGCKDIKGWSKVTGYHKCDQMPEYEFAEKQNLGWHIHSVNMLHSQFRIDLKDGVCPYCKIELS